jgi:GxxExxY protein
LGDNRECRYDRNAIAKELVDAAFRIHTSFGPGLLESVYDTVLAYELDRRGLRTVRQQSIPVVYENVRIDTGFRADLMVEDKVIVEVKSVELVAPVHRKQLLTYRPIFASRTSAWGCSSISKYHSSKMALPASSMGSKKILTQSRQAAKTDKGEAIG